MDAQAWAVALPSWRRNGRSAGVLRCLIAVAGAASVQLASFGALAQISISGSGTPVVTLPLAVPPGIAGVAPSLALVYDGRNFNGPLGHGWSLQGASAIARCHGIPAVDGVMRTVANGPEDKLCLDAQRLIQVNAAGAVVAFPQSGDSLGLASGSREFRTEKDSFSRIRAYGSAGGLATNGPAYFKVWTKDGQILEYGNFQDVSAGATVTPVGKTVATSWLLSRVSDLRGNYVDFRYEQRNVDWGSTPVNVSPTAGREVVLKEILYTGTPAQAPVNKVTFLYDERPAQVPVGQAHDRSEAYALGSRSVSVLRLAKVQTFVNAIAEPIKVKTYKLAYGNGSASNRSRLERISECAGPAEQPCLPATRLEYAPGGNQAYQASAAFRASNLAALAMHSTPPPSSYAGATPPVKYGVIPADFTGDGRTDILRWSENAVENQLHVSNGDGSFSRAAAFNITDRIFYRHDGCFGSRVGDFDGDGLPDILRWRDHTGTWPGSLSNHACPAGATELYMSQGDGGFVRKPVTGVSLYHSYSFLTHGDPAPGEPAGDLIGWSRGDSFYIVDVNADGRLDIVFAHLPAQGNVDPPEPSNPCPVVCTRVFVGDGQGGFSERATNVAYKTLYSPPEGTYALGQPSHVNDIDGDGLLDITNAGDFGQEVENARPRAWRNLGNGSFEEVAYGTRGFGFPIDFNGDFAMDLILPSNTTNNFLYLADGSNNMLRVGTNIAVPLKEWTTEVVPKAISDILPIDIDGDGRQDMLRWHNDPSKNTVFLSNGDGTFRESTTFNLKSAEHALQNTAGTNGFIFGDFTGRGRTEILRMAASPGSSGAQSNQLYLPSDAALPADQLVAVVSGLGLRTDLAWVPLGNPASGPLGERYRGDRGFAEAAVYPLYDALPMGYVVASSISDSGVAGQRLTTEYAYRGQKSSHDGRRFTGFREVRSQQPAADGTTLTTAMQFLQPHPYTGAVSQAQTWRGGLNEANPQLLSTSTSIHCDKTAEGGAEANASVTAPCATSSKIQRPYVYKSIAEVRDLGGSPLPITTTTTTTSYNDTGDPIQVVARTEGSVGSLAQSFVQTTDYQYHADITNADHWILGRMQQVRVANSAPNSLPSLATSAGNAANATATAGSGPIQGASLSSLSFGSVAVGASSTLAATLTSNGLVPLSIGPAPGSGSISGSDFSFVSSDCPTTLAVGSSCTVTVRFAPTAVAARSGGLALGTGGGTVSSSLTGLGSGAVATLTSAATLQVPAAWYGGAARTVAATYRNDGNAAMSLATPALVAPLAVSSNTCTNVAPGAACSMVVSAATGVAGLNQSQVFSPSGATNTPAATTVTWSNYTAVPRWSSTSLAFGSVTVGKSLTQSVTLINDGNSTYNWAANNAVTNAPAGYSFNTSACSSVAAGGNCTVSVSFAPTAAGSYSASGLTMGAASYSSNSFSVSGAGITPPSIAASAAAINASAVAPAAASGSVSFSNGGQTPTTLTLTVSGGAGLSSTSLNCPANATCGSVTVTTPSTAGTYNGALTVVSSAGGSVPSVAVNLAVLTPPSLGASPASLAFSVPKGDSASKSITFTNSGAVAATGLAYAFSSGTSAVGDFSGWPGTCPAAGGSLAAGASCTYSVTYSANCTAGSRGGSLRVSGANFTTLVVSLDGATLSGNCE
jgi:hypothetical protein